MALQIANVGAEESHHGITLWQKKALLGLALSSRWPYMQLPCPELSCHALDENGPLGEIMS